MLISSKNGILNTDDFECLEQNGYKYYYSGIIWTRGKKAGEETIKFIAGIYENNNEIPFIELFGSFYCVIVNPNGKILLFTDNSNMHTFFLGKEIVGSNFLEVMKADGATEFNKGALCEFLQLGDVYFGKTLMKGITLSESEKYYLYENGKLNVGDKKIGGIDEETSISDVNLFFEELSYALSDYSITMSLTGGYDSRMVFASMKKHVPINIFISGNNLQDKDIVYSQRVAKAGRSNIDIIDTPNIDINEDYIHSLFEYSQGVSQFLNNGYIRISEFIKDRKTKGFNCYLTGDGGVLHKDWWWMQDLPFYRKKSFDFNKFYSQRINYKKENIPFGTTLEEAKKSLQNNMIEEFTKLKMTLNTQTYDTLYFNINGKSLSTNYSIHSNNIRSYAPLWERELVRYSYHLPRRSRFFYNSIRKITTKASKDVARIPTNYGTTASSESIYIMRDIIFQGVDYFKKGCRMLGRKYFNKNLFIGNPITWTVEDKVRSLTISTDALEYSIENNFIKNGTELEDISFSLLGKLIQVYLLGKYITDSIQ